MYDDDAVFELFREGNLNGIFQFASQGIQVIAKKVQPRKLEDIALAIAMYRPGPLSSGIAFEIDSLRASPHKYGNGIVDSILVDSGGIIVYQEQLMQVWQYVADGTMGEADILRKLVGKKITGSPKWKKYRNMFFVGGKKKGMSDTSLQELWSQIEGAGMYSFNKSHALSYAMLAYDTAYYKVYHPVAFFASMMQYDSKNALGYVLEATEMGYNIKPVDVNVSTNQYEIDGTNIIMPLSAVKGVGQVAVASIIAERESNGAYLSCKDFRQRLPKRKVNKRVVRALFGLGGFDEFADYENLGLDDREVVDIKAMKNRELTKQFLGFSLPTMKLMKAIKKNSHNNMMYGIITHVHEGIANSGRKYFKVVIWPDFKTFFFKKTYSVSEGDVVKIYFKPRTQSGTALEVVG